MGLRTCALEIALEIKSLLDLYLHLYWPPIIHILLCFLLQNPGAVKGYVMAGGQVQTGYNDRTVWVSLPISNRRNRLLIVIIMPLLRALFRQVTFIAH